MDYFDVGFKRINNTIEVSDELVVKWLVNVTSQLKYWDELTINGKTYDVPH